jgi:hypothetical protein
MPPLTRAQIVTILGPVDDDLVVRIIDMGATAEELAEARAWVAADDTLMKEGRPRPSGRIGDLVDILCRADEDQEALLEGR